MAKVISKGLRFFLFLSIGLIILWWLYKDQDPQKLTDILKKDVGYGWIFLSLVMGLLSHISRTIRWQMLIEPVEKRPGLLNTFLAVMIGYLANLAIPRMGEISRCAVLSRYENTSFSRLVGTVVTERVLDMIMLLLSLFLVVILQYGVFAEVVKNKMELTRITDFFSSWKFYISVVLLAALIVLFRKKIVGGKIFFKLKELWAKFKEGLFSYRNVKNKPMFFIHTVLIFVLYFLMIYVCFFGFPFTRHLGPGAGLAVFVLGSFGMVAPVQGGIGPWHFLVISTLLFFGVEGTQAAAFALLVHGSLNGMIIVTGLLSLIAIPLVNKVKPLNE
ncbi:lysylphosphatidylglycerol synthase transmembrane domain-containing protein [Anaerophaga thermohalophila]|uniref:lysylphosphatidylglycerol synthase transmembrane domain-containing protein n=1 Tax=Anaerophaga thermohalophila TaxID=177400 RepID=UPI00030C82C4|nr:lysylphosphatidylglycerol synthase transmembrane domain-containing protein [Anaerophaga thermohalophila]